MTMNKRRCFVFAALMAVPVALLGQDKAQTQSASPANPITASEKGVYSFVSNAVVGAAQKMPEENYSLKPTPEVRSFGQLVGHVADASYMFCSLAIGEANPAIYELLASATELCSDAIFHPKQCAKLARQTAFADHLLE